MIDRVELAPDAVAAILEHDGHSFIPLSRDLRLKARMQVSAAARSASTETEGSIAFRTRLESVHTLLSDEMRDVVERSAIVFVESPLPHASLTSVGDEGAIIVCRGLFDLVHFRTALSNMCAKLADAKGQVPNLGELSPAEAMMLAGQVALFDAYANLRAPASVSDVLRPGDAQNLELGVNTSLLLLILHELGHDVLGHAETVPVSKDVGVIAVKNKPNNASRAQLEFDADAFAISAILPQWRPQILASAISLVDIFQFLETFGVRPSQEYPPVGERLTKMVDCMDLSIADQRFARSWLEDYEQRRKAIDPEDRDPKVVARHFERVMDVKTAYKVMYYLRDEYARLNL